MPKRIATLDCETDPFLAGRVPEPFVWGLYDGLEFYEFETTKETLAFLEDKDWIVYAHNGGRFDYMQPGFLESIEALEEVLIINGRLAKFRIGNCEFRDSVNILPVRLKDLGCKDEIDYAKMEKEIRRQHWQEIIRYLRQDCVGLWETITKYHAEYGRGVTLAGNAMKYWKTLTRTEPPRTDKEFYQSMAPYYYGGRVECFHKGEIFEPFQVADINSAYPFAMLHEHPISTLPNLRKFDGQFIPQGFYTVEADSLGAFPFRDKQKLVFPSDGERRVFNVTGWEILTAQETSAFQNWTVHNQVTFDETINFRSYVHHFYLLKQAAAKGTAEYIFAKLFMNSLYGKFGANPEKYKTFRVVPPEYREAAEADTETGWSFHGELGPWLLMGEPLDEMAQHYYNVATAASITGFVRAYLWRHIHAIQNHGHALYCDTDSIAFAGPLPSPMTVGKELGEWDVEAQCDYGAIAGKKMYAFRQTDGKWKTGCKGARLSASEICRVAKGEVVEWENEAPTYSAGKEPRFMRRKVIATV